MRIYFDHKVYVVEQSHLDFGQDVNRTPKRPKSGLNITLAEGYEDEAAERKARKQRLSFGDFPSRPPASCVFMSSGRISKTVPSQLGDLKESPSLGESSHVMFSRMAKYSSLTGFYTFSEQQPKAIEDKVCLHQVLKFMYRAVKSTKICSVPRMFKTKCKLFMCAKGKH